MEQVLFDGCFVCGPDTRCGLKATFKNLPGGEVEGVFTPDEQHSGYEGVVHTGVIVGFLDETMGRVCFSMDKYYLTQSLNVIFKCAASSNIRLRAFAKLRRSTRRHFTAEGKVFGPSGEVIAEAEGRFVLMDGAVVKKIAKDMEI